MEFIGVLGISINQPKSLPSRRMLTTIMPVLFSLLAPNWQGPPPESLTPIDGLEIGSSLVIALGPGGLDEYRIMRKEVRPTGWTISGTPLASNLGAFVLVCENGEVAGWVSKPNQGSWIATPKGTGWELHPYEIQPLQCEAEPTCSHGNSGLSARNGETSNSRSSGQATDEVGNYIEPVAPCPCDDGNTIDLLVLHTNAAKIGQNSAGVGFDAFVQLALGYTNQAFVNSGIPTTIRMVQQQEVTYSEGGVPSLEQHLFRLQDQSDGYIDEAHPLRDDHAADLVTLFVNVPGAGGVAFIGGGADAAFSVNSISSGLETLAHELGHNFGGRHDPATELSFGFDPLVGDVSYSYGHKFQSAGQTYYSIMSYYSPGEMPYHGFSNPDVVYQGTPTGLAPGVVQPAANAYLFEHFRGVLASYRDDGFADCDGNGVDDQSEILSGAVLDSNENGIPDDCESRLHVDGSSAGGDGTAWSGAWPDLRDAVFTSSQPCGSATEVWVAAGTYYPDRGRGKRWMSFEFGTGQSGVFGGFIGNESHKTQRDWSANPTILSGDLNADDLPGFGNMSENSYHVVHVPRGGGKRTVLDGFRIQGGNANQSVYPHDAGGGLRVEGGAPTVRNAVFEANSALFGGGVNLYYCPDQIRLVNVEFLANRATIQGGAIQTFRAERLQVFNCRFTDNEAKFEGGGVAINQGAVEMEFCNFGDNSAGENNLGRGGGAFVWDGVYELDFVRFEQNQAGGAGAGEGGGLWVGDGSSGTADHCTFIGNHSTTVGGGYSGWFANQQIKNAIFDRNEAALDGGGAHLFGGTIQLASSTFTGNSSLQRGGGLFAWNDADQIYSVRGSTFQDNQTSLEGGGVWLGSAGTSPMFLTDCTFQNNHSDDSGGGVFSWSTHTTVYSSYFLANTASIRGGAMSNIATNAVVQNCAFSGNAASLEGGSIYNLSCPDPVFVNSTILNSAPDAIFEWASEAEIHNSILWDCGLSPVISAGGSMTRVRYCAIEGGFAGSGNVTTKPWLADQYGTDGVPGTGDEDFSLLASSPAGIDAGNNDYVLIGTLTDLLQNPRFMDDPNTPDSGNGIAPLVDMGATEFQP